jgi:soluble P-type ATPase
MIEITVPGYKTLRIEHLVMDYNGTLACDGKLLPAVRGALEQLAGTLQLHVVTADTFGKAQSELQPLPCELSILPPEGQDAAKLDYVRKLGPDRTASIGNGRNDRLMLKESALGIAVLEQEGSAADTLQSADVVCPCIASALDLLKNPKRLTATLRV